jgi:hypothetical protein
MSNDIIKMEKQALICTYYDFEGYNSIAVKLNNLGVFDTYEDALWKQIELQEQFITLMDTFDCFTPLKERGIKYNREADDIISTLNIHPSHYLYPVVRELIEMFPVLTYTKFRIVPCP